MVRHSTLAAAEFALKVNYRYDLADARLGRSLKSTPTALCFELWETVNMATRRLFCSTKLPGWVCKGCGWLYYTDGGHMIVPKTLNANAKAAFDNHKCGNYPREKRIHGSYTP